MDSQFPVQRVQSYKVLAIARLVLESRGSSAKPSAFVLRGQNKGTKQKAAPAPREPPALLIFQRLRQKGLRVPLPHALILESTLRGNR